MKFAIMRWYALTVSERNLINHLFTNQTTPNSEQLSKGIYFYQVRNKNCLIKKTKAVKE
jgi:hypothetical protein